MSGLLIIGSSQAGVQLAVSLRALGHDVVDPVSRTRVFQLDLQRAFEAQNKRCAL